MPRLTTLFSSVFLPLLLAAQQPVERPGAAGNAPSAPPANGTAPAGSTPATGTAPSPAEDTKRVELNLLGKVNSAAGESRRNENVQFNLVDNNALKELNLRLGVVATIVQDFRVDRGYFGSEFGNAPTSVLHVAPARWSGFHGNLYYTHQNSIFSARSFFQVGGVKPARENDYGFRFQVRLWRGGFLQLDGSQDRMRGNVNGNVLVPKPDERTPLATDPAVRALVARFLSAYPAELPNRTDINARALNTNSPQVINNNNGGLRLDQALGSRDRLVALYQFTAQHVEAFELVAGQNPNTDTKSHRSRLTWNRTWSPTMVTELSAGFDRIGSLLVPEKNAVGVMVSISGLETLGPQGSIPIDRGNNMFRYAGALRRTDGQHQWYTGFGILRRQFNGIESDAHRGVFSFANDFGRDAITNLRMGIPTQYIVSIGEVNRGFRNWDLQFYAGDNWKVSKTLSLNYGLRYTPAPAPHEVFYRNPVPYSCDCNNLAPEFGFAWKAPGRLGIVRSAYALQYGEIYPVTFQQTRFSPPGSEKIVVPSPNLLDPLSGVTSVGGRPDALGNLYLLAPDLRTPYSHQYNFSWEPELSSNWKLQFGYVGSRSHKLLIMWYLNRGQVVPGIPQTSSTLNQRRADPTHAEIRYVTNGSRGYYDAFRASLFAPRWHGLSMDMQYWFSKAMDLGAAYSNTAYDNDSRISRSQNEHETHADMRGLSSFDQPHAFLWRGSYALPGWNQKPLLKNTVAGWNLAGVVLIKQGTPFTVITADGPGFGNVDGNGNDRPNLVDPSILGRTVGNPDDSRALLPKSAFSFIKPTDPSGNLGRNTFRKGVIHNVNATLWRSWVVTGEKRLTLRAESVNLFNTPQFADPGLDVTNPNFAQITNTLNDGRTFRFQLQFSW